MMQPGLKRHPPDVRRETYLIRQASTAESRNSYLPAGRAAQKQKNRPSIRKAVFYLFFNLVSFFVKETVFEVRVSITRYDFHPFFMFEEPLQT